MTKITQVITLTKISKANHIGHIDQEYQSDKIIKMKK